MTDRELELQLRAWYQTAVPAAEIAPPALRADVLSLPQTVRRPLVLLPLRRRAVLLAAAAALVGVLLAGLLLGPGREPPRPTPSPSPGGTIPVASLAVLYQVEGLSARVFTLDLASGEQRDLDVLPFDSVQARSGTSARIAWSSDRRAVVVYRVADGATLQAVLDAQTGGVLAGPAPYNVVSPLADRFAQLGAEVDVWDLAGQPLAHLPLPAGIVIGELGPWSPDAATLLLGGCQPCNLLGKGPDATTRVHIHVLPVDGSPLRTLGDELIPDGFDPSFVDPAWSPDGASIAASLTGIVVVDAESGRITRLTSSGLDVQPAWSPDGSRIAYVVSGLDGQGIWVMAADGSNPIRLTTATTEFGDRLPVWSPDGSTVLFTRGMQNAFGDLWQVPSTGGTPGLVLSNAVAGW